MRRYLLYAAAYGAAGILVGLAMAYYTKDVSTSVLLSPDGIARVTHEPTARERIQPQPSGAHARED